MSSQKSSRGGGWNFRAIVCTAAFAVCLPLSGKLFGSSPGYVKADSRSLASALLDHSRGEWSHETQAIFALRAVMALPAVVAEEGDPEPPPVEATMGGTTTCPAAYTVCPQVATKCEYTKCPPWSTQCPIALTTCPKITTFCPVVATTCELTKCPVNPTKCPVNPTVCEDTKCPPNTTVCPVVPTTCELTYCPKTTVCGSVATICYGTGQPAVCVGGGNNNVAYRGNAEPFEQLQLAMNEPRVTRPLAVTFVPQAH